MKKIISIVLVLVLTVEISKADFTFGTPTNLGPTVNSSTRDLKPSVSSDGLSLYFTSTRAGGVGGMDIWVTTRETTDDPWSTPVNLGSPVNSSAWETGCISYDGLSFYFSSTRYRGSNANADMWVTTRDTIHDEWSTPMNLGPIVNSLVDQCYISISADELSLYFSSNRSGGYGAYDLWVTTRETIHDPWGTPVNLGATVNSSAYDVDPSISADGRILFFASDRSGGYGGDGDIWMTSRATTDDPWGEPVNLGPTINSSAEEDYPNVSADGSILYFRSGQSGRHSGGYIFQAPIIPIVDFTADGIVDADDMCIMVDHWGEDYPLCDIGPMPWGDGIVDVQDLIILAEHLFEEILPPELIAYWKLDETEGDIAYDSTAVNDAVVFGGAVWQPAGGMVDGALQLDGIDDYVSTDFVLNPADGSFSVFAWIKGGAPGQVVLSQMGGARWLCADLSQGNLMTELMGTGRGAAALLSQAVITDGNWHRIGLVWNGVYRTLYVDDIPVAEDTQSNLEGSKNGLYIGCGDPMQPETFFSGLIDDVRVYNRAVKP
jgi:hypothetical protein